MWDKLFERDNIVSAFFFSFWEKDTFWVQTLTRPTKGFEVTSVLPIIVLDPQRWCWKS